MKKLIYITMMLLLVNASTTIAKGKGKGKHRIEKMKQDAAAKIEAEKKQAFNKLNNNFLDEVIGKAKTYIKGNPELASKATDSALEGLK